MPGNKYDVCLWGVHLIQVFGKSLILTAIGNWNPLSSNKHEKTAMKSTFRQSRLIMAYTLG